ncbi:MAG: cyclic nucleotide-binding domain-containing protein [Chloroflexi bacterium]|nr:cyclic nucleotide-binding domain-containing protein [Chloroflexota bacterium]
MSRVIESERVEVLEAAERHDLALDDGSRVAVVGGGPSGSLFSYFLLQLAQRIGIKLAVDIYERRDFSALGAAGCNMCGGVISESLLQALSVEGIKLPADVVQRGIDSFTFHTAEETVTLYAPYREMRIGTVYRGGGPKGTRQPWWRSFDGYLLQLAVHSGARVVRERVADITWDDSRPQVHLKDGVQTYDLLVGAIGVNTPSLAVFEKLGIGYKQPKTRKTSNIEFELGSDYITRELGSSMHAFLLDLPKLDFAALIPKGDYVTMCLIGENISSEFVDSFVQNPVVKGYLAGKQDHRAGACRCAPLASLGDAVHPFGNRVLLLGDCGTTRLNKDGIGSAYRVAKTAAVTALFRGISSEDFREGYGPLCRSIHNDNRFGRVIFDVVDIIKRNAFLTRAVMRMARSEQQMTGRQRRMSMVLWDMFTGSAPYRDVFVRCLHPAFWSRLVWNIFVNPRSASTAGPGKEELVDRSGLGREYRAGEIIVRQGEQGDCMYVIQSGQVEVLRSNNGQEVRLAVLGEGDIFGEMAIFQKEARSATVRALTNARVLSVDRKIFLRRVHEDPSFVFTILQKMSQRIREMDAKLVTSGGQSEGKATR